MAVAFVALLAALSGTAVALPGKNSVKADDIARNAVSSPDIKNRTIRGLDVKNNALGGRQINESKLGTVPSANTANTANSANTAGTANLANSVGPSEGYREIGSAGNPQFHPLCRHATVSGQPDVFERVAFYKDLEGVVHLRGTMLCDEGAASTDANFAFQMPPGYRPRDGKLQIFSNAIGASGSGDSPLFFIAGANMPGIGGPPAIFIPDGAVVAGDGATSLDGTSYRAEG